MKRAVVFVAVCCLGLSPTVLANDEQLEHQGLEPDHGKASIGIGVDGLPPEFLMIPDLTNDVVGAYDPYDGTYIGDIITGFTGFSGPINAVQGPDCNIYVSDRTADAVNVFDPAGNHLYTYADSTDGLDKVRGIDFRNGHLFVTSGDNYVAQFDGPHNRLADFIADGSSPYDILFLDDGSALMTDIQSGSVRHYDANGTQVSQVIDDINPLQVQFDSEAPGAFLNIGSNSPEGWAIDFDLDGTIYNQQPFNVGYGIYRLGNDNLLLTSSDGVWEMDPATGVLIENENPGVSARYIELYGDCKPPTVSAALTCLPESGLRPFTVDVCVVIDNLTGNARTFDGAIDVITAGGLVIEDWRTWTLNLVGGESYLNCWDLYMGYWPGLVGDNTVRLTVVDTTPAADAAAVTASCTVNVRAGETAGEDLNITMMDLNGGGGEANWCGDYSHWSEGNTAHAYSDARSTDDTHCYGNAWAHIGTMIEWVGDDWSPDDPVRITLDYSYHLRAECVGWGEYALARLTATGTNDGLYEDLQAMVVDWRIVLGHGLSETWESATRTIEVLQSQLFDDGPDPPYTTTIVLEAGTFTEGDDQDGMGSNAVSEVTLNSITIDFPPFLETLACSYTCMPSSGDVPFATGMTVTLDNLYTGQTRRFSGRIKATLANGSSFAGWRAGFTNVAAGDSFVSSWSQNIPALDSVIGTNLFELVAEDVTPSPYNQPPYPPAGETATASCTVIGIAP